MLKAPKLSPVKLTIPGAHLISQVSGGYLNKVANGHKGRLNVHLIWSTLMQICAFICIHYNWNIPWLNGFTLSTSILKNAISDGCSTYGAISGLDGFNGSPGWVKYRARCITYIPASISDPLDSGIMVKETRFYELLEVDPNADDNELKRAHRCNHLLNQHP